MPKQGYHHGNLRQALVDATLRLIAAQFVRPFVKTNKTDAADAQAIWEAAQRPGLATPIPKARPAAAPAILTKVSTLQTTAPTLSGMPPGGIRRPVVL